MDFDYEPSIASHDPLDDDLVPECPPPNVFPEDVPEEDEDPIHGLTSGVAVTASIARDAATVLPQDHVQGSGGVRSVALAPRRLQRRRFQNMAKAGTIVLATVPSNASHGANGNT